MIDVDAAMRRFAEMLARGWDLVAGDDEVAEAWLQANWELLVESELGPDEFLNPYSAPDWYADSSRISRPSAMPTHIVVVVPRGPGTTALDAIAGKPVEVPAEGLVVDALVARTKQGYWEARPPFDHVRTWEPTRAQLFSLDDVVFRARPIRSDEI